MNRPFLLAGLAILLFFTGFRAVQFFTELHRVHNQAKNDSHFNHQEPALYPETIPLFHAGPTYLQALHEGEQEEGKSIQVEWTGSFVETLQYLQNISKEGVVGPPDVFTLESSAGSGSLTGKASFSLRQIPAPDPSPEKLAESPSVDPFKPLINNKSQPDLAAILAARERKKRQEEEARLETERTRLAEREKQDAMKRSLKQEWSLTGIVHDGTEAFAFLDRKNGGENLMVRRGDQVGVSTVFSISEADKSVVLDVQNQFQVTLTMTRMTPQ